MPLFVPRISIWTPKFEGRLHCHLQRQFSGLATDTSDMTSTKPAEYGCYIATVFYFITNSCKVLNHRNFPNEYIVRLQENAGQLLTIRLHSWHFYLCLLFWKVKEQHLILIMSPLWAKNGQNKKQNRHSSLPACLKSVQLSVFVDYLWPRI